MDVLYEESAVNARAAKEGKKYKVVNIISWIALVLGVIFLMIFIPNIIASFSKAEPTEDFTAETDSGSDHERAGNGCFLRHAGHFFRIDVVSSLHAEKTYQRKF